MSNYFQKWILRKENRVVLILFKAKYVADADSFYELLNDYDKQRKIFEAGIERTHFNTENGKGANRKQEDTAGISTNLIEGAYKIRCIRLVAKGFSSRIECKSAAGTWNFERQRKLTTWNTIEIAGIVKNIITIASPVY